MAFRPTNDKNDENTKLFRGHIGSLTELEQFFTHAVAQNASDIILQTNEPAIGLIYGEPHALTSYVFQQSQIDDIAYLLTGNHNIKTSLATGRDYNHAFEVRDMSRKDEFGSHPRLRFRLCATAINGRGGEAKQLVMRHIQAVPPTLDEVDFPEELIHEFAIQQGAFLIAGETGSGKTTTFAACLDHILKGKTPIKGNIVTYEEPIEYLFSDVPSTSCVVAQSEVGLHVPSFREGIVNAMRRKPSLIVVGELRDPATIQAAADASVTGHPVFGTVHANDSSAIIRRMVMQFDPSQQQQMFSEICSNVRLLMSQYLVPRADKPGRVCLRDWVVITPQRSEELIKAGYSNHHLLLREWMESGDRARSMKRSIEIALEAGRISLETANLALKRYGYEQKEPPNE